MSNARRAAERAEWERQGLDLESVKHRFAREILAGLKACPLWRSQRPRDSRGGMLGW